MHSQRKPTAFKMRDPLSRVSRLMIEDNARRRTKADVLLHSNDARALPVVVVVVPFPDHVSVLRYFH